MAGPNPNEVEYTTKVVSKNDPTIDRIIADLSGNSAASFSRLAHKYRRIDWLEKAIKQRRNELNADVKSRFDVLFTVSQAIHTRVIKTASLVATLSKTPALVTHTEKFDNEGFTKELESLLDGLNVKLTDLHAKYTTLVQLPEPKQDSAKLTVKATESVTEGLDMGAIKQWMWKYGMAIKGWLDNWDEQYEELRSELNMKNPYHESKVNEDVYHIYKSPVTGKGKDRFKGADTDGSSNKQYMGTCPRKGVKAHIAGLAKKHRVAPDDFEMYRKPQHESIEPGAQEDRAAVKKKLQAVEKMEKHFEDEGDPAQARTWHDKANNLRKKLHKMPSGKKTDTVELKEAKKESFEQMMKRRNAILKTMNIKTSSQHDKDAKKATAQKKKAVKEAVKVIPSEWDKMVAARKKVEGKRISDFMNRNADIRALPGPYTWEWDPQVDDVARITCSNGMRLIAYLKDDDFEVYD